MKNVNVSLLKGNTVVIVKDVNHVDTSTNFVLNTDNSE